MQISLSGEGSEVIFRKISPEVFYSILARVDKYSPDGMVELLEYQLKWSYSNSNPIMSSYALFADDKEIDVDPKLAIDSEEIVLAEPDGFYIASLADAEHKDWFSAEVDGDFDLSKLEACRCQEFKSPWLHFPKAQA